MKIYVLLSLIVSVSGFASISKDDCVAKWDQFLSQEDLSEKYLSFVNKCDDDLKAEIKKVTSTNKDLGYTGARRIMFSQLDNVDGIVCGVYTARCIETYDIPNGSVMNCEHSWPQSQGAVGIAKSDLHHLYPANSNMNSRRSNYPFCEVDTYSYEENGSYLGYSSKGTRCFEPTNAHKGDLARSMIYFAVRYQKNLDSEQEGFFRKWMTLDPVSDKEILRNDDIEAVQNNRNPFVDYPALIDMISDI